MSKVAIVQNSRIAPAINEALGHLEIEPVVRGKVVAVKPNETWASSKDITAVTQADTLQAVLQFLKRFSPKKLIVTGGAGAAETEDVFRLCGILDVIREEGVEFVDHNRGPFQEVELSYGESREASGPQKSVTVSTRIFEYETLVSLAQLKVHSTATVTLCLKNIAMSFPAADYYGHPRHKQKHPHHFFDDMHSFIAAMTKRFPAQVGIIVGHPAMVGLGPIGGHTFESGIVIASRDPVAADAVGAQLLGFSPQAVRHLWEAEKMGLGQTDTSSMEFPIMSLDQAFASFTKAAYGHALSLDQA